MDEKVQTWGCNSLLLLCTLLYVDDCLVISDNAENVIRENIGKYFELKQESIKPPDLYLGGHMRQVTLDNGVKE